ncbi:hypothetical protein Tco_0736253 [Tanacetum coccineum]
MLHRLCRPSSIPLSFGLATVLPRRSVSRVSWAPDPRRPRANTHRLRNGLPRFPTAVPRGIPGRVSFPVWLIIRKDQLSIIGLLPENNVRLACVEHIASVTSEPGLNSSFDYDLALQCLVIDILDKLVKSRQTLSKAMVARNGFSQVINPPYG